MADDMKQKTNGKINFYKTGNIKRTALHYFYDLNKTIEPESISNNEAKYLENASFGALTYWEPFKGTIHSYDINSYYPSILSKNYHYFPIKEGEYQTIETLDENLEYGIYRCIISPVSHNKFFRFNKTNYYTHIDIINARRNGLVVELIQDGKPNCLVYTKDKLVNGAFLFKKYVTSLYELKSEGLKGAKDLLNILWGALCEMNYYKSNASFDDEINITEAELKSMTTSDDGINMKYVFYKAVYYKNNFARMKPFVLAYGRSLFSALFKDYESDIVRIHTDGFYLKSQPKSLLTGTKLGHLKYEGQKMVDIKRLNQINVS